MSGISYLSAESVTSGHPDKLSDLIADSILDECLKQDEYSRVACEVLITAGNVILAGEITCKAKIDYISIVKDVLKDVGYDPDAFNVTLLLREQSSDIRNGVNNALEARNGSKSRLDALGAGDQGIVYGYATNENHKYLPTAYAIALDITKTLEECRKTKKIKGLRPDGKALVTLQYCDSLPSRIHTIVVSAQHEEDINRVEFEDDIEFLVIRPACLQYSVPITKETQILINPSGRFVLGGPDADTGLTGRKLGVDTYGGLASHGGGAFSGKDATKADRSGAYMARYAALNLVASNLAARAEVSIAYAIGRAHPIAVNVNTFGTGIYSDNTLRIALTNVLDFRPAAIIEMLKLRTPIFASTSVYGAFNIKDAPWEQTDNAELLREVADATAEVMEKH